MRILLVNDDGIFAPGLAALRQAAAGLGEVTVVAPETPQSAAGRSITLHSPVRCRRVDVDGAFWGISVSGRPADCVKLAVRQIMDAPPELVLAGINPGANAGVNVFYSGTVAAAAEGALFGIPSVAFSLSVGEEEAPGPGASAESPSARGPRPVPQADFHRAGRLCRWVLDELLAAPLHAGELVNVNIPPLGEGRPRGVKLVPQSTAAIHESYARETDAAGGTMFRLTYEYHHDPQEGETDVTALAEGFITVTPLKSDLTDQARLKELGGRRWAELPD